MGTPMGFFRSAGASFNAVPIMRPAATAPMPRNALATSGFAANSTYSTASVITITSGTAIIPPSAANAPRHPKNRSPTINAILQTLGPGSTCPTASNSTKSSFVTHRLSSHSTRCATASTPPNPCNASHVKLTKRSAGEAGR
jgi:hypothetical protein